MEVIEKQTDFLPNAGSGFWLGPTTAICPRTDIAGGGDMLLAADCMEKSDGVKYSKLYRSTDEGRTWAEQGLLEHCRVYDRLGSVRRDGYGGLYADELSGLMFYFGGELFWERDKLDSTWRERKLYYRVSYDNGFTWSDKIFIIQKGSDQNGIPYDAVHYMKDVVFGRNMAAMVISRILRLDDGSIIIGIQSQIADENGEAGPTGMGYLQCGALKGRWIEDTQRFEWEFGQWVKLPLSISTRGIYEPAHALLPDGRILMVCRGSNYTKEDQIIGCKFMALSGDKGMSWSNPEPLVYDDGSTMYSSSCIPKVIKHSNGKLYFVGVICKENPKGNLPRYPLCIAEIDQKSCRVIKRSVFVVDTKPEDFDDTFPGALPVDFSNHWVYEDKAGHLIVMAPYRPDLTQIGGYLNRYEVTL